MYLLSGLVGGQNTINSRVEQIEEEKLGKWIKGIRDK